MEKHLYLKKYINPKKMKFVFSSMILLFILSSSIAMADTGSPEKNKLTDVQNSATYQAANSQKPVFAPKNPTFLESQKNILNQMGLSINGHKTGL